MSDKNLTALVLGMDVNNSQDLASLTSCKKDAEDLSNLLVQQEYTIFGNDPLIGSNMDKECGWIKVRRAIADFFTDVKPSQTLLFYFSGYGISGFKKFILQLDNSNREKNINNKLGRWPSKVKL